MEAQKGNGPRLVGGGGGEAQKGDGPRLVAGTRIHGFLDGDD